MSTTHSQTLDVSRRSFEVSSGEDVTQSQSDAWQAFQQLRQSGLDRLAVLTSREMDVLRRVVQGDPNKTTARHLTISIKTVEKHRSRIMSKLQAGTLPDLMRIWLQAHPHELGVCSISELGRKTYNIE